MASLLRELRTLVALLALGAFPFGAPYAQTYPDGKSIRLVVPFAPGGAADIIARFLAEKMGPDLGTSVFVENRGGGDGAIGAQVVASAKPDGLTLLVSVTSAHTLTPLLTKGAPDPIRAFAPISTVIRTGLIGIVRADLPVKTFPEYVAYVKNNPGKSGMGASTGGIALTSEKLKRAASIPDVVVVNYKGPSFPALLTGEIDFTLDPFNSLEMIKAGKVRPLALIADHRSPEFPDVPTFAELGYQDIRHSSWVGLLAPAGTHPAIIERLHAAIAKAAKLPEAQKLFRERQYELMLTRPEQFASQIAADTAEWKALLSQSTTVGK